MMTELIKRVIGYSKTERIQRLIELSVNETPMGFIEIEMIQAIREENGECDEVREQRQREIKEQDE